MGAHGSRGCASRWFACPRRCPARRAAAGRGARSPAAGSASTRPAAAHELHLDQVERIDVGIAGLDRPLKPGRGPEQFTAADHVEDRLPRAVVLGGDPLPDPPASIGVVVEFGIVAGRSPCRPWPGPAWRCRSWPGRRASGDTCRRSAARPGGPHTSPRPGPCPGHTRRESCSGSASRRTPRESPAGRRASARRGGGPAGSRSAGSRCRRSACVCEK